MHEKSQFQTRLKLGILLLSCAIPSCFEAAAIIWGELHGFTGKALRDGLDFWAGGFLYLHGHVAMLFDHAAYQSFLQGLYGHLPYHLWSYPPTYGLVAASFAWLPPWPALFCFDAASLVLLAIVLRLAGKSWWFVAAMMIAPATLENALEHQNAALMTALLGGGVLLLEARPRLAGALIGLATIKPQFGLVLPLNLLRRSKRAFAWAALAAVLLAGAALAAFGPLAWRGFFSFTSPAMTNVLLTGKPKVFAGGLMSTFAAVRPFTSLHGALAVQVVVSLGCIVAGVFARRPAVLLILCALATPYLHDYDLLGAGLAVALLTEERLRDGFRPGEPVLFFLIWAGPGLLPWVPRFAHLAPLLLLLLLASAWRRGGVGPCDSSPARRGLPESSAGPSPTPAPR